MKEYTIRRFFEGEYAPEDLERDYPGTVTDHGTGSQTVHHFHVEPMAVAFDVEPAHIVQLVDAALSNDLRIETLQTVSSWLEANPHDNFNWDTDSPAGERVSDSLFWLGTPEINYPLTPEVLRKIRHYLLTGENQLNDADARAREADA